MYAESKKIILVANSDKVKDINSLIDDGDVIVRFNVPEDDKIKKTGYRTDILFLANTVDLMEDRLKSDKFNSFINSLEDTSIVFPFEDELISKINPKCKVVYRKFFLKFKEYIKNSDNNKYVSYFEEKNIPVDIIDQSYYWAAKDSINADDSSILSTGFIAATYFLNNKKYSDYDLYLCGFTFEGWSGHSWSEEKRHILNLKNKSSIHLI
ncbi:hypothetical protein [Acinetobacter rudis]|uniref:Uncharacterized protein n=1 Tax=Acinetobacter rudis TaxID=632955 RepID=A0AAW8J5M7_9GAMM|nr:hypothetical protein [Acinetobacter rudis]MDQ8934485.1 hypothetical protein [Acinetobacter rudis]MDQ9016615.1 hypothetical protein [Acinetobacter rudis]